MNDMLVWLLRRWPRCKPYDTKIRFCLGHPEWNGRCTKHIHRARLRGEQL